MGLLGSDDELDETGKLISTMSRAVHLTPSALDVLAQQLLADADEARGCERLAQRHSCLQLIFVVLAPDDRVMLEDMEDPENLYLSVIKASRTHRAIPVNVPQVFGADGQVVHPSSYSRLPMNCIAYVELSMRLYVYLHFKS